MQIFFLNLTNPSGFKFDYIIDIIEYTTLSYVPNIDITQSTFNERDRHRFVGIHGIQIKFHRINS